MSGPRVLLRPAGPADAAALQACLDASSDYFTRADGAPAAPDAARDLLSEAEADPARRVLLVRGGLPARPAAPGAQPLGLVDLHLHQPEPGVAHVGLLLLVPAARGRGLGREVVALLAQALAAEGFAALRASVADENPEALAFWEAVGLAAAGRLEGGITVLERPLG